MIGLRAAFFAALTCGFTAGPSLAEDVTLTSRDGSVTISGDLLAYDGEFYRVATEFGVLTVDGTGVVCDGPGCPDLSAFVAEVTFSGARTMGAVLLPALVENFAIRNGYRAEQVVRDDTRFTYVLTERETGRTAARLTFHIGTTAQGFADLIAGEADLAMALREPTADEQAASGGLSGDGRRLVIALDALVPVVSPANEVSAVSLDDLALVLSGRMSDWSELGGPDGRIRVHLRDRPSGMDVLLQERIMDPAGLVAAPPVRRHADNDSLSDAVARDPAGLGVTTFSHVDNARALSFRGACGFETRATPIALKTEDYPLTTPLFLYVGEERLPLLAREFLAFARSPAAGAVIRRAGFVDLGIEDIPLSAQGDRLANAISAAGDETGLAEIQRMVARLRDYTRLSITFRFRDGTALLDAQSAANVDQLADALEAGRFDGEELLFVGFSDGSGTAEANLNLARRRAEAVREAVLDAAPFADRSRITLRTDAFGEASPVACDESNWGRQVNRRVEVWRLQR